MPAEMQHKEMQKAKNTFTGFGGSCGKTKALIRVTCMEENKDEDCSRLPSQLQREENRPDGWRTAALASSSAPPSLLFNSHPVKSWREMENSGGESF